MIPKKSVLDVTDLYHPAEDPGDNFDIIMPFGLDEEIDLKGVILDVTEPARDPVTNPRFGILSDMYRDPGIVPMSQMNYIFNRQVPYAVGPFSRMETPDDPMTNVPLYQQQGIDMILNTLRDSSGKVDILSFGSARAIAAAYNREPDLLREKVGLIHLCAGSASTDFWEHNVFLDPNAIICLLSSELPIAIYPCANEESCYGYGSYNSFYSTTLEFVKDMDPMLKNYLSFAFNRIVRMDFLRAMDLAVDETALQAVYEKKHSVWETAVWAQAAGRKLVKRGDGTHRLIPEHAVQSTDIIMTNDLLPCKVQLLYDGHFTFELTNEPTNFKIYYRGDPYANEAAMKEALAHLYTSFRPSDK